MEPISEILKKSDLKRNTAKSEKPCPYPATCPDCGTELKHTQFVNGLWEEGKCSKCEKERLEEIALAKRYKNSGLLRPIFREMYFNRWEGAIPPNIFDYDIANSRNVYIYGKVGTGKTHLIAGLCHELIKNGQETKIVNVVELLYQIKSSFDRIDNTPTTDGLIKSYGQNFRFLAIDDLGAEKGSEWVSEIFYVIMNQRYEFCNATFITSNFSPEQLAEKLNDRLISRLIGHNAIIIKLTGDDYRFKGSHSSQ